MMLVLDAEDERSRDAEKMQWEQNHSANQSQSLRQKAKTRNITHHPSLTLTTNNSQQPTANKMTEEEKNKLGKTNKNQAAGRLRVFWKGTDNK